MTRAPNAWTRYWFADRDGTSLGLVRIGVALTGLILVVSSLLLVPDWYSDTGYFPLEAARYWGAEWAFWYLLPEGSGAAWVSYTLMGTWIVVLGLLLVGRWMRWVPLVSWILGLWFFARDPIFLDGGDEIFRLVSLYLALTGLLIDPRSQPLSLDRRRAVERGDAPPAGVPAWTVRLIQIQIMILYMTAGFWKVVSTSWWDGSALYLAYGSSTFSRFGVAWLEWMPRLGFIALTVSTAWWEFLFPVLVSVSRTRRAALAFGVALHLSILAFMSVGLFPFSMLACYPAFLTDAESRGLAERIPGVRRLIAPDPAPTPA